MNDCLWTYRKQTIMNLILHDISLLKLTADSVIGKKIGKLSSDDLTFATPFELQPLFDRSIT